MRITKMIVGYERLNANGRLEEVVDSTINDMADVHTRLQELKTLYAEDDSVKTVFYAIPVNQYMHKVLYSENA